MSYNIISMKLSFLVLSKISFLSLKARVIILYGLPFVNTFFINFYIFFEKRCNSRKPAKNAGFQALHHLHFSLFRLFSKKYFKKHFISTVKHTGIFQLQIPNFNFRLFPFIQLQHRITWSAAFLSRKRKASRIDHQYTIFLLHHWLMGMSKANNLTASGCRLFRNPIKIHGHTIICLLYTSDAADEL